MSVFDGQTVVLGGLIREDVQKIEDKVPLLGDIPLLGRLFRSSVDQHLKRNLVIFVSARLINPAGEPVRTTRRKSRRSSKSSRSRKPRRCPSSRSCRSKSGLPLT